MQQLTGVVAFDHATTGRRLISREALRDLPGHIGYRNGITEDVSAEQLLTAFSEVIDRIARRYPDAILVSAYF